jgi:hypothetical protein
MRASFVMTSLVAVIGLCGLDACRSGATDHGAGANAGAPPLPASSGASGSNAPNASNAPPNGSSGSNSDSTPPASEPPPTPYVAFDVNHVISTGQSNSVAHEGIPVFSVTQPFSNVMFDVGVMTSGVCEKEGCREYQKPTSFMPLIEGDSFWYPVETMSSGLGNEASMLATAKYGKPKHDVLVSLAGRNGLTYWCLRKGGCTYTDPTYVNAFDENLRQVADAKAIATAAGKTYVVRAVTAIHGESDDFGYATGTPEFPLDGSDGKSKSLASYADALIEWQRDYEAGVKAITGQTQPVPLFVSQVSSWNDTPTGTVAFMQLEAHLRARGKVIVVAPGYLFDFASDCRHYTNHAERRLGEYFGKAYARTIVDGRPWEPLRPDKITHAGNVVTATFVVPAPPLVLDTERIVDPGNYGFEAVDAAGAPIAITSVALSGPTAVKVTLARDPGAGAKLRYAYTHAARSCAGRQLGARGNLRDSDTTPSNYGYELFNWSVHFDLAIE